MALSEGAYRSGLEVGGGWQAKIQLGTPGDIEAGCFCLRIIGREIKVVAYAPDDHDQ